MGARVVSGASHTPLVERLRGVHAAVIDDGCDYALCDEAADTINELLEALEALLAETETTYATQLMDRQDDARRIIKKVRGQ